MNLNIIAAINNNRVIGDSRYNGLLWKNNQDLLLFKKLTLNSYLIMGKNTWESLNCPYLPKRFNSVISSNYKELNELWKSPKLEFFESIDSSINYIKNHQIKGFNDEIFFIGGLSIYKEALKYDIKTVYLSKINNNINGDLIFPDFEKNFYLKVRASFNGFEQYVYKKIGEALS
ncbi:MAG: dihydrofolate reductase [Candidatus Nanoarchaeia archaeon]|nr:dihydrofolate reductase [Candidatus Nanoarchaeia archaeon]